MFGTVRKKKAVAYVDFDYWCISMYEGYGGKPDVKAWRDWVAEQYDLRDIYFFGDFSNPKLRGMLTELREISNTIIETQNSDEHNEKEYTDFIMLDHIYQRAMLHQKEKAVLIFSGDGHFSSVVSFLRNKCHKEVVVYGIRSSFSNQLKSIATRYEELPLEQELNRFYYRSIYRKISDLYAARKNANPTFRATATALASALGVDREIISRAMQEMLAQGYLYQAHKPMSDGRVIKILKIDSEKTAAAGFFE